MFFLHHVILVFPFEAGASPSILANITDTIREAHLLHLVTFWVSMLIIVIVFGGVLYSLFRYRHSQGDKAAHFHRSAVVELVWTLIPFALLVVMLIPAIAKFKSMHEASQADQNVTGEAHQHLHHEYPDTACVAAASSKIALGRSHADVERS